MKKLSAVSLILCLLLLLQTFSIPALATQSEPADAFSTEETVPTAEFGTATVLNGCRTMDAQMPLAGSDRMLESAVSAFVYERNTGTVVYSYNPDLSMQPGTLAKIVTAIVAIENGNLDEEVTISSRNYKYITPGAKNAKLKEGEIMTLRDLIYCMFLEWANDAAVTIAEHISGTQEDFVKLMNRWAEEEAGCKDTRFADCHGLGSENQNTTARDLARIVEAACKNAEFRELFGANSYEVPATNKTETARKLKSLNYLKEETIVPKYNYKGVTGGIAHYTNSSGASLVCTAERKGMDYIIVVMGCKRTFASNGYTVTYYGNYEEAWTLLEFAFNGYKLCRLLHDGYALKQFTVSGGENDVVAQSHTNMDAILPVDAHQRQLIFKYSVQGGGLTAPIQYDQKVGTLQIFYRTSCVAETELFAMSSVRAVANGDLEIQGAATRDDSNLSGFLSFLGIACLIILVPLIIYVVVNNVRRLLARNLRRKRRKSRRRSR